MKLYYAKGACSLAIRITIHEIGIPCHFESVNLQTKQTETSADFLKINPKGYVPALLLESKEILTENTVIQQYLTYMNNSSLLPTQNRYHVLEWLSFVSTELHKVCGPLFNKKLPEEIKEEFFVSALKNKLTFLDQQLSNNQYLLGNYFTCADSYLFVVLSWLPHFKIELSQWPNVARYFDEVKSRPAVQRALKEEGLA